jgi:hypothetical protein
MSDSELSQTSFTVLLKRMLARLFTTTILAVASSTQCVLFQTIPATHLKLHPSVQLNDPWGLGITSHVRHTVSDVALHFDLMKLPFGHCGVHLVQWVLLLRRNV